MFFLLFCLYLHSFLCFFYWSIKHNIFHCIYLIQEKHAVTQFYFTGYTHLLYNVCIQYYIIKPKTILIFFPKIKHPPVHFKISNTDPFYAQLSSLIHRGLSPQIKSLLTIGYTTRLEKKDIYAPMISCGNVWIPSMSLLFSRFIFIYTTSMVLLNMAQTRNAHSTNLLLLKHPLKKSSNRYTHIFNP